MSNSNLLPYVGSVEPSWFRKRGSFDYGGTISSVNTVLLYDKTKGGDGNWYQYVGNKELPFDVIPGSIPDSDWKSVGRGRMVDEVTGKLEDLDSALESIDKKQDKTDILTSLLTIPFAANKVPFFTSETTVSQTDLTIFSRKLLAAASAAEAAGLLDILGGKIIGVQIFITSGTCSFNENTKNIIVEGVGAGAGGGGSSTPGTSLFSVAGGGASGSWGRALFPVPTSPVQVTIGTGGARGVAGNNSSNAGEGSPGGDTSFGSLLVLPGGKISKSSYSFASNSICSTESSNNSGSPTVSGDGKLLGYKNGVPPTPGVVMGTNMITGRGGDSYYGVSGIQHYRVSNDSAAGSDADGFGAGGGGACSGQGTSGLAGGLGGSGIIFVWELS